MIYRTGDLKSMNVSFRLGQCKGNSPPLTNPLVAIAEVDNPVIVVTTVAITITRTERPLRRKKKP